MAITVHPITPDFAAEVGDVVLGKPLAADDPILALPNVVLSPHNAGQTPEVVRDGLLRAVANVEHFLAGKPTDVVVAPA